ncbi:MAG TPA: AIR synthase-related protein, partial [Myxococcota bacterium]
MRDALPTGKLPPALLRELLDAGPALPPEVRLGPRIGEDACAIEVAGGALVVASDPITLTGSGVGAHAVVINANDVAVMGVRPRWFLATALFPAGTRADDVRACFAEMREALRAADIALVGGHTEVTEAVTQTLVVGQMLGLAEDGRFVPTGGARPGDAVVQVGPAPVEGAAVLAAEAGARLGALDASVRARAAAALAQPGISVVAPALRAAQLGATALHDPTEGGLACGLHELAEASGVRIALRDEAVLWFEPGVAVCAALGADPWGALASGALLAAFPEGRAEDACRALSEIAPARAIGRAEPGSGVVRADGSAL